MSVQPEPEPAGGTASDADGQIEWHHLHKVTPLLNAWKAAAVVLAVAVWNFGEELAQLEIAVLTKALVVVGAIVLGALIGLGYGALAWRRTRYGISDESVFLHSGVLWRQQRHVRLDRLQAVDVTQPLLARLFGFSSLKIESAGGADSNLTLSYLTDDEAQRVRNEILVRAAGVKQTGTEPGAEPVTAQAAPERQLYELTSSRLVGSLLRSPGLLVSLAVIVGFVVLMIATGSAQYMAGALPGLFAGAGYVWSRFAGEFSFRIGISADGVRLRHGLLESKARTVPPGRVQALVLTQPLFWRSKDWWRIRMTVAGYGNEQQETVSTVLYPVATSDEVRQILPLVLPDLGTPDPVQVLEAGMTGSGPAQGFITSSRRARRLDPFTWQRNGIRITDTAVLLRSGWLGRTLALVPHVRTQSLEISQGPIERRLDLAGLNFHLTTGPVSARVVHLDATTARELLLDLAEHARQARKHARPERWMDATEPTQTSVVPPASSEDQE